MSEWTTVTEEVGDAWNREGTVQGVYLQKKTNVGPNESNMYVLKTDKGNLSIWGSIVLDSRFEQIPLGSEVRVGSLGKTTSKKGSQYYDYTVEFRPVPFQEVLDKQETQASLIAKDVVIEDVEDGVNLDDIPF